MIDSCVRKKGKIARGVIKYLVAAFGVYLCSKICFILLVIGFVDVGLVYDWGTWAALGGLFLSLLIVMYLVYRLLYIKSSALVAAIVLCAISVITLLVTQGVRDCMADDEVMICAAIGVASLSLWFSIGCVVALLVSEERPEKKGRSEPPLV